MEILDVDLYEMSRQELSINFLLLQWVAEY